jgi:hypothetical protein
VVASLHEAEERLDRGIVGARWLRSCPPCGRPRGWRPAGRDLDGRGRVITGAVELRTDCGDDGVVCVSVRYEGTDEWYRVRGGTGQLSDPTDAQVLHQILTAVLHRPQT